MRRTLRWLAALLATVFTGCSSLPFHPDRTITLTPDAVGLPYIDVTLATADGVSIAAWYLPRSGAGQERTETAALPGRGKTLLFFHGNAGNLSHRLESLALFHKLGLSVFIIDYRGFGNSGGKPSVNGTALDAAAAWDWLIQKRGVAPRDVIIFGRSLGGGVAAALAAEREAGGLILESTFTCLEDVAAGMFPWLPVGLFIPQDYDSAARLASARCPVLFVHSPDDEVVPYRLGRALYEGYAGPKTWLEIRGPHNSGYLQSGSGYTDGLASYLRDLSR